MTTANAFRPTGAGLVAQLGMRHWRNLTNNVLRFEGIGQVAEGIGLAVIPSRKWWSCCQGGNWDAGSSVVGNWYGRTDSVCCKMGLELDSHCQTNKLVGWSLNCCFRGSSFG